jgi:hypothetical protein
MTFLKQKNHQNISLIQVDVVVCLQQEKFNYPVRWDYNLPEEKLCRSTKT